MQDTIVVALGPSMSKLPTGSQGVSTTGTSDEATGGDSSPGSLETHQDVDFIPAGLSKKTADWSPPPVPSHQTASLCTVPSVNTVQKCHAKEFKCTIVYYTIEYEYRTIEWRAEEPNRIIVYHTTEHEYRTIRCHAGEPQCTIECRANECKQCRSF